MTIDVEQEDDFEAVAERTRRAMVSILIEGDDDSPLYVGSGVLIRLAGVELVATAGHNVWSSERGRLAQVSVSRMSDVITTNAKPGDASVQRVFLPTMITGADPEPDVAVIEPSERAIIHPNRVPFEEDEIGFLHPDAPERRLALGGFPSAFYKEYERVDLGSLGRRTPIDLNASTMIVHSMAHHRFPREPKEGRGVHVFLSAESTEKSGTRGETPPSSGMSGGPLVARQATCTLVALVRSRMEFLDGYDQWCEPIVEAVRLLLHCGNVEVAAAARRVVDRCDALATQLPPTPAAT
jgi:hypothetical protein